MPTAPPQIELLLPQPENHCFGCGGGNPHGLQLSFELDHEQRQVRGHFQLDPRFQGSSGVQHGGITALLLDEAMGKLARLRGVRAVTAELSIAYLRPIAADAAITVTATEIGLEGRNLRCAAEIRDAAARLLTRASARFVILGPRG